MLGLTKLFTQALKPSNFGLAKIVEERYQHYVMAKTGAPDTQWIKSLPDIAKVIVNCKGLIKLLEELEYE